MGKVNKNRHGVSESTRKLVYFMTVAGKYSTSGEVAVEADSADMFNGCLTVQFRDEITFKEELV